MVISVVHNVVLLDVSLTQFAYIECTSVVIFHCVSITMCKHQCVSASVPECQCASMPVCHCGRIIFLEPAEPAQYQSHLC